MTKIMFVCHGNICRSPMAEFVFKNIVSEHGVSNEYVVSSSATSREEIGNPVYPPVQAVLRRHSVPVEPHFARQFTVEDYENYDYVIIMDSVNRRNLLRIIGEDSQNKVHTLLSFAGLECDISDPWYSGEFERSFSDVVLGCTALFEYLNKHQNGVAE
ncbi:MAG: low molecular weight protein-tyrosine-phosphatase [Acutalibacteraceae bacterium]